MFKQEIFLLLVIIKIISAKCAQGELIVETSYGKVQGHVKTTLKGREYVAFQGVPYAEPPIGDLRFEEPKRRKPWSGVWIANTLYRCLQYNHYTEPGADFVIGQEDCLYLNIYTPKEKPNGTLYDVIIFIHGGAFMFNSGASYGPAYILDRDVVFVTLNYRLGPLGFLSTEDSAIPGNNGMRDQILALKWVKENIKNFNGNPESITLTGMSAGGSSVHLHLLSPQSHGLFHRGMIQSGAALNAWVLMEKSREKARKLASLVGCDLGTTEDMKKCMKTRSGYQIVNAVQHFLVWLYNPFSPFGVVIDKWTKNPVLPDHPYKLLKKRKVQDVPVIFSCVGSEGTYPAADLLRSPDYLDHLYDNWNHLMPFILDYNNTVDPTQLNSIGDKIKSHYMGDKRLNMEMFPTFIKLASDRIFVNDIEKATKMHAAAVSSPVHFYYFSYRGAHSKSEDRSKVNTDFGAAHGDDSVYVLSSNVDTHSTERDRHMSEIFIDMWTTFAKNSTPKLSDLNWTPVKRNLSSKLNYAHIESPEKISMKEAAEIGNGKFWNSLGIQENDNLFVNVEL